MRGPTREEQLKATPPELRMSSKTTQAYLNMREKILQGVYPAGQVLVPKQVEEDYHINNTTTQILLMRLANEGLVQVLPVKARSWPNNAAFNEYRVADLDLSHKQVADREQAMLPGGTDKDAAQETLLLKIQYADTQIASLLAMAPGDRVIVFRERLRAAEGTVLAITESYVPFWFAEMLPELELGQRDLFALMRLQGKNPMSWTETVDVALASSVERVLFELSPDDPAPFLKLQRQTLDQENHPLAVQFFTLKPEYYRLQYRRIPFAR